jgi:hypothetical protein
MTERKRSLLPKKSQERSQTPLYIAIGGLGVAIYSFTMAAETIRTVVMFGGLVIALVGVAYWFLNPKHGLE